MCSEVAQKSKSAEESEKNKWTEKWMDGWLVERLREASKTAKFQKERREREEL